MKEKMNIKFDLIALLEDIAQMGPDNIGVDNFIAVTETRAEEGDARKTYLLVKGDDVISSAQFLVRAMSQDRKLALIVSLAAGSFIAAGGR